MDPAAHDRLRERIRQIIAERHGIAKPSSPKGGFIHLLPMAAAALPSIVEAGKKLFTGSGKHKPDAATRKPNEHAQLVRKIMADAKAKGKPMKLPEASQLAKALRDKHKK